MRVKKKYFEKYKNGASFWNSKFDNYSQFLGEPDVLKKRQNTNHLYRLFKNRKISQIYRLEVRILAVFLLKGENYQFFFCPDLFWLKTTSRTNLLWSSLWQVGWSGHNQNYENLNRIFPTIQLQYFCYVCHFIKNKSHNRVGQSHFLKMCDCSF